MTGPVLAFDASATRGGKLTLAPVKKQTPKPQPWIDVIAAYGGLLGVTMQRSDLAETLPLQSDPSDVVACLRAANLKADLKKVNLNKALWPALVVAKTSELVLVLESDETCVTVYDPQRADKRREIAVAHFNAMFTGQVIVAEVSTGELTARHAAAGAKAHWFWSEVAKFRRIIGEVALGSLVANMLAVAVALFSLQVYDRVIPHQSTATLWVLAIGAGLAMLLEAFLRIARARLMDGAGRRIEMRVQSILMDRVLGMQSGQGQTPSQTFALMVLPSFFLQRKMMKLTLETQGASTKASRLLHEAIYDADTIKAQRGEDRFRRMWTELTAVSSLATSEQRKLASTLTFWSQGVQQATYVAAVVMGTFMVFQGQFTVGTIIAVGILTSRTLGPLTGLAATLARWSNVKAALTALDQVADAAQDTEAGRTYLRRNTLRGDYALHEMSYSYDEDGPKTIDIAALSIVAGQRIAVLGSNGSGKSTLLKVLSGLHRPRTGRVLIDGIDMNQVMPRDLRRSIGYLSQEVRLFAGSLRENLNLTMLERDDDRLIAALEFAGLGDFIRNHPKGLDLDITDGGAGLSIGQRQSIGWARLWLQDPQICLLDEPTAALDQKLEAALVARLGSWLEGRTAIIATHRRPILALTNRTMVLQNGRLAVDGPQGEVLAHLQGKAG